MKLRSKQPKSVVGLEIEAGSAAAAEVRANGSVEVVRHGVVTLDPGAFRDGEVADPELLGDALKELFSKNKLAGDVRVGIANQRVAVRVLRLPALDDAELEAAIRFQAQDQIPMPLDQAVLDWQVTGRAAGDGGQRLVEVVAVAARRDMLAGVMHAVRCAGLRPVGIDHSAFGMIRALARSERAPVGTAAYVRAPAPDRLDQGVQTAPGAAGFDSGVSTAPGPAAADPGVSAMPVAGALEPADGATPIEQDPSAFGGRLYCNLGDVTNLAVAHREACLFTRISPFGIEAIAQRLAERRELTLADSREWLTHVGLDADLATLDGDPETLAAARAALDEGAAKLGDELRISLEFYAAQEGAVPIEAIVACGPGTTIPGLTERLQQALGRPFEIARTQALAGLDPSAAARLTVPYGIALEG